MDPHLELAEAAARAVAPDMKRSFAEGSTVHHKSAHELMSDADLAAENAIVEVIRGVFPDHEILGEESHRGAVDADHLWVIDPIDGTNNFVHGIPHYGISIAYLQKGVARAGVVYHPMMDEMYSAVRGAGAFLNGEPVSTSPAGAMNEAVGATGFSYHRGVMTEAVLSGVRSFFEAGAQGMRRMGAASLDLCYVGCGRFEFYFEYDLKPWDFAAGALFVEEAGGKVSAAGGGELPLQRTGILASNAPLHETCLEIVTRHCPPLPEDS